MEGSNYESTTNIKNKNKKTTTYKYLHTSIRETNDL